MTTNASSKCEPGMQQWHLWPWEGPGGARPSFHPLLGLRVGVVLWPPLPRSTGNGGEVQLSPHGAAKGARAKPHPGALSPRPENTFLGPPWEPALRARPEAASPWVPPALCKVSPLHLEKPGQPPPRAQPSTVDKAPSHALAPTGSQQPQKGTLSQAEKLRLREAK